MKKILNADESKEKALETITEIARVVKATLGPGGNPIIIQQLGSAMDGTPLKPLITKDGVTVAENIRYRDPGKDSIAQAILQVAQNTVRQVGDGTTTAIVLAEAIYKAGYKHLSQGANGIQLYNGLKKVKDVIIDYLDSVKIPVKDQEIFNVARISANGDEQIAKIVHEAVLSVGEDGYISLEEGYSRETKLEKIPGAMYKQGWRSFGPHGALLVNDKARNMCELSNPAVLLYSGKLDSVDELGRAINRLMGATPEGNLTNVIPLLIVAHDYSDEVKNFVLQSRIQAKLPIAAIKSPFDGSPNARTEMLEDLAVLLGATVGAKGILELDKFKDEHFGCAGKVEISAEETVFFNGQGSDEAVLARVADLKQLKETRMHDFDRENLHIRIGKLLGGIAIIRVGGDTELEMREKKDRIEDALCAARVAITDGIVPGGGSTLYEFAKAIDLTAPGVGLEWVIMKEALQAPIRQIIANVGENPEVVLSHLKEDEGYDAAKKVACDMLKRGIIDPTKVTKAAVENAVSIAGLLLTTGGAIVADAGSKDGAPNPLAALGLT